MKRMLGSFMTLILVCLLVFGGAFMSHSQAAICSSPTGYHYFYSHQKNGAGYSESAGIHYNHFIGYGENGPVYQTCQKTRYYDYCQLKCSYCGALDSSIHTHSYIRHSADNSIEQID